MKDKVVNFIRHSIVADLELLVSKYIIPCHKLNDRTVLITGTAGFLAAYMMETLLFLNETRQLNVIAIAVVRNRMRAAQNYAVHYSGGLGAMGFALLTAIGVAFQSQDRVVVIAGVIQMNIQELDTLNWLALDIPIIVMNNSALGMVKNFQDMYFNGRDQSTRKGYSSPSFTNIAQAYGIESHYVTNATDLDDVLSLMTGRKEPLPIEIMLEGATECRSRLAFGSKLDEQFTKLND